MKGWQKSSYLVEVKAGDRLTICQCGKSSNPPYCDGSHKGTEDSPHIETFDQDKTVLICGCLESGRKPFCDGTHSRL